jgi:hypothetical protein
MRSALSGATGGWTRPAQIEKGRVLDCIAVQLPGQIEFFDLLLKNMAVFMLFNRLIYI